MSSSCIGSGFPALTNLRHNAHKVEAARTDRSISTSRKCLIGGGFRPAPTYNALVRSRPIHVDSRHQHSRARTTPRARFRCGRTRSGADGRRLFVCHDARRARRAEPRSVGCGAAAEGLEHRRRGRRLRRQLAPHRAAEGTGRAPACRAHGRAGGCAARRRRSGPSRYRAGRGRRPADLGRCRRPHLAAPRVGVAAARESVRRPRRSDVVAGRSADRPLLGRRRQ
jgi:hypothetical protein